jgi:hypothetical protein
LEIRQKKYVIWRFFTMSFSKVISKSAAVVAALGMMLPAVGVAAPAVSTIGNAIVASAAEDWNVATVTGDQYVKVGGSFTFKVECREWVKNASYEWQMCNAGSTSWSKVGSNSDTYTGTMTSSLNGAHIRCKVTNSDNNVTDYTPVRTLSSLTAAAKLGTATKQSDGSYKIPLTITGLKDSSIGLFYPEFDIDSTKVDKVSFQYDSNFSEGDNAGFNFYQQNNPIDLDGDGKTDKVEKVDGVYLLQFASVLTPGKVSSNNTIGYLYVTPKSGVSTLKVTMKEYDGNSASLYGSKYDGNLIYGMSYTGTTIGGSTTTTDGPICKAEVQGKQFRLTWTAVKGASAYAVALYQNGAWRCKAQVSGSTLKYTSPKGVKSGNYQISIVPKVNGEWVTKGIKGRSITVTIRSN